MVETRPPPPDSHSGCARRSVSESDQDLVGGQRFRQPRPFGFRIEHVSGVVHFQGIEDPLLLELIERLARDDLDHPAEHVGRMTRSATMSGLPRQR
jgi:hypothetical protein